MTHEATVQGSSSAAIESSASAPGENSLPSQHAPSHGHAHNPNDAFLQTLRPLLNLYESPTSPAWGCRK
ncbi:MAG: hypothetical protein WC722_11225 [Rhodospirillales bacterium]|jgi:hypothetical protein